MEKTDEETSARFDLSLQMNGFSTDLLRKRSKETSHDLLKSNEVNGASDGDDELELSLGLSMNGRFGVDPARKRLKRSSSISDFPFAVSPWDNGGVPHHLAILPRTRSLPTEAEEEWRKRKEYQSMRRFEARKKRLERVRSGVRAVAVKDKDTSSSEDVGGDKLLGNNVSAVANGNENVKTLVASQMNASSQSSGFDHIQQLEGPKQNADAPPVPPPRPTENQNRGTIIANNGASLNRNASVSKESAKNAMLDMPHVSTRENGPDGRKVEGFLYRYKKGEDVSIVCVCHGMFLSPAEFVKHGGGGGGAADLENPLKHIVVSPFPLV